MESEAIWDVDHPNIWDYVYGYYQYNSNWHKDKITYYKSSTNLKEKDRLSVTSGI